MINWQHTETGEVCHINFADFDGDIPVVLVMYFGSENGNYSTIYPIEDFFNTHEPKRYHS